MSAYDVFSPALSLFVFLIYMPVHTFSPIFVLGKGWCNVIEEHCPECTKTGVQHAALFNQLRIFETILSIQELMNICVEEQHSFNMLTEELVIFQF